MLSYRGGMTDNQPTIPPIPSSEPTRLDPPQLDPPQPNLPQVDPTPIDAPPSDPLEPLPEPVPVPTPTEPDVATGMADSESHEGATDVQVGDRTGPGAGFNAEPTKVTDTGGVAAS